MWLSHPSWYITPSANKDGAGQSGGTIQSRPTCKRGAHQTDPPEIEDCRRSRWHGGSLVSIDLSQIELRVPALLCGEPVYLNAYLHRHDLHSRTAALIWGDRELQSRYPELASVPIDLWGKHSKVFNRRERQVAKRVNFSHLFRAGAEKMQLSAYADIGELFPLPLFEAIVRARPYELPVLYRWQESLIAEARRSGRLVLPLLGQSRFFLQGAKYDISEIVNFPVQTTASNVLLAIQSRVHELLRRRGAPQALPFLNVYDALKFDCRLPSDRDALILLIEEAVRHVATDGYWGQLSRLYNREVPLEYEVQIKESPDE